MTHYKTASSNNDKTASIISEYYGDRSLTTNHFMGGLTFTFQDRIDLELILSAKANAAI